MLWCRLISSKVSIQDGTVGHMMWDVGRRLVLASFTNGIVGVQVLLESNKSSLVQNFGDERPIAWRILDRTSDPHCASAH